MIFFFTTVEQWSLKSRMLWQCYTTVLYMNTTDGSHHGGGGPFSSPSGGFGRARPSIPFVAARRRGQRSTAVELEGPRIRHGGNRIRWWGSRGMRVVVGASAGDAGGVGWRSGAASARLRCGVRRRRRARRSAAA